MKTNKKRTNKLKIAVVIGLLCCMAMGMSVMAFDLYYSYDLGKEQTIGQFVPNVSTIYLNTRPSSGGDVTITLSGAAKGSALFPYYTTRNAWVVSVPNPTATLTVRAKAGANGSKGTLHIWG